MGFGISTDGIPTLNDYQSALRRYERTKPIRGKDIRPLASGARGRRKKHMQIIKRGNSVTCRLYGTDCVVFHDDGRVTIDTGAFYSNSTYAFIEAICPWIYRMRGAGGQGAALRRHNGEYWRVQPCLTFDAERKPIDPQPFTTHKVDRIAMRAVRKKVAAFTEYAIGVGRVSGWVAPKENKMLTYSDAHRGVIILGDDLERWYLAYTDIVHSATKQSYVHGVGWVWVCDERRFKRVLDDMLKHMFAEEVLIKTELPLGVYTKDTNAKYAHGR